MRQRHVYCLYVEQAYTKSGKGRGRTFERERKAGPIIEWASDQIPSTKVKKLRQPSEISAWKSAVRDSLLNRLWRIDLVYRVDFIPPRAETRPGPRPIDSSFQSFSSSNVESSFGPLIGEDTLRIHQGRKSGSQRCAWY